MNLDETVKSKGKFVDDSVVQVKGIGRFLFEERMARNLISQMCFMRQV